MSYDFTNEYTLTYTMYYINFSLKLNHGLLQVSSLDSEWRSQR